MIDGNRFQHLLCSSKLSLQSKWFEEVFFDKVELRDASKERIRPITIRSQRCFRAKPNFSRYDQKNIFMETHFTSGLNIRGCTVLLTRGQLHGK